MDNSLNRRTFLLGVAALPFLGQEPLWAAVKEEHTAMAQAHLLKIEKRFGGRIGLFAINLANGATLNHRGDERFPVCSTFKVLAASAILVKSSHVPGMMERRINYRKGNLVAHSPITEKHVADGMTVAQLCAAAIQHSDNTAANLLLRILGGPKALTAYARSIGDTTFRLDRWETALNTAIPGDSRDTSTPKAMGNTLQKLVIGDALAPRNRQQLREWMLGNTTGASRIKAGIPANWKIGDKTGSGDYGTANDIAVLWPLHRQPVILAIYTRQTQKDAEARSDVIAAAARTVVQWIEST